MVGPQPPKDREKVVRLGHEIYDRIIGPETQPTDMGKYYAVDTLSDDFEVDTDSYTACARLRARRPDAEMYLGRVGFPTGGEMLGMRKVQ